MLEINDRHAPPTSRAFVKEVVDAVLSHVGRPDLHVSLLLTGEREIAAIHGRFLGDSTGTDVISFPMDSSGEGSSPEVDRPTLFEAENVTDGGPCDGEVRGVDVVVSVERAERESRRHGHTLAAELALYIVHGILHVCGYDDTDVEPRAEMRRAEAEILASIGLHSASADA